jgi:hypothetical protein
MKWESYMVPCQLESAYAEPQGGPSETGRCCIADLPYGVDLVPRTVSVVKCTFNFLTDQISLKYNTCYKGHINIK